MKRILPISALYVLLMTAPAHAYIDPVTGSIVLQTIIGGFAAALVAIRRVRERVLSLLGLQKTVTTKKAETEDSKTS